MNKQNLIRKIKEISDLNNEEKQELIELLNTQKRYGLIWEEKPEEVEEELNEKLPVLLEVKERAILCHSERSEESSMKTSEEIQLFSKEEVEKNTAPNHILIEGDNLHALTVLNYTHAGQVDVIYIDPPYNTGNKDFKYNDRFVDKEDSYRHSKWLSFMNKRLKLARNLLKDTGVIFISIDDNEVAQLKLLCDEVFGEENLLGIVSVAKGTTTGQDAKKFGSSCDYLLAYSMNSFELGKFNLTEKDLKRFNKSDDKGFYSVLQWRKTGYGDKRSDRPNLFYELKAPDGTIIYPIGPTGYESRWRGDLKRFNLLKKDNMVEWIFNDKTWKPYIKYYSEGRGKSVSNLWLDIDGNKKATIELKNIFGDKLFTNPKPTDLILKCLEIINSNNVLVLDFFAGSGTTLHSVLQANQNDSGTRQCILVTNNENNIAEEVCYERNKRVINGYTKPNGETVEGLKNNNLRYYKTSFVGREKNNKNRRKLTELATDMLCIKEDCYELVGSEEIGISNGKIKLYANESIYMMIILEEDLIEQSVEIIKRLDKLVKIYIFSPGQYPFTDDFEEVINKVELCALPEAIYKAYKSILPKKQLTNKENESTS